MDRTPGCRWILWGVALAASASGCGEPASDPAPPLHLFDDLEGARFDYAEAPGPERRFALGGPGSPWRFAGRLTEPSVDAEQADRLGLGRRVEGGGLRLDGSHAAAFASVVLDGAGGWVELNARLALAGHSHRIDDGYARLGLVELDVERLPADLSQLPASIVGTHFTPPRTDPDERGRDESVMVELDPRTRSVLIVCEQVDEAQRGATARFDDVRLHGVGPARLALRVADEPFFGDAPPAAPVRARFAADLVHRHGVALPAGAELCLPLGDVGTRRRFQCFVAALGRERTDTWTFVAYLRTAEGGDRVLGRCEVELVADGDPDSAPSGWVELAADLPEGSGAGCELVLSLDGAEAGSGTTVGVVAGAVLSGTQQGPHRPNLLLVSLDTLRADRVGAERDGVPLTPHIDRLAAVGTRYPDVWSTAPYTLPATLSMLSGQAPMVHGVQRLTQRADRARTPLLAERLQAEGYRTAAFTAGGLVLPRFGFAAGFERYGTCDPWPNRESARVRAVLAALEGHSTRSAGESGPDAIDAVVRDFGPDPWFLFVHTYAAHEFDPPRRCLEGFATAGEVDAEDPELRRHLHSGAMPPPRALEQLTLLYDAAVRQADELVGELVAGLDARGELGRTVVAVTSDHGKELGERLGVGHGHTLFEELLQVPLVLHVPGRPPAVDAAPASSVDLVPTLLAALGVAVPSDLGGRDLFDPRAPVAARVRWAEVDTEFRLRTARRGAVKVVHDRDGDSWSTFDLAADPHERGGVPSRVDDRQLLERHLLDLERARDLRPRSAVASPALQPGERAQLEALGYTLGGD